MVRMVFFTLLFILTSRNIFADGNTDQPVKIGIAHCCVPEDLYLRVMYDEIKKYAEKVPGVTVMTRSANGDAKTQLKQIQELINDGAKALLISVVVTQNNREYQQSVMDILKKNHTPAVFYVKKMPKLILFQNDKAFFVSTMAVETAIEQGQLLIKHWLKHPEFDLNHDGIIQYAIVRGTKGNFDAETRTKWVQATINHYPGKAIRSQLVDIGVADWRPDLAEQVVDKWLDEKKPIEVILANDDGMALGVVAALEKHHMKLPVYGIHALPEVLKKIKEGEIMGTVSQAIDEQAKEMVNLAVNMARGKPVTNNTREKIFEHEMMLPNTPIDRDNVDKFLNKSGE